MLEFSDTALADCLSRPLSLWGEPMDGFLSGNTLSQVQASTTEHQSAALEKLWQLLQERRQLDLEYRLHQVGRLWLLVHGPAAWLLAVLLLLHIAVSVFYGGY